MSAAGDEDDRKGAVPAMERNFRVHDQGPAALPEGCPAQNRV
jgi:hypothetical protein